MQGELRIKKLVNGYGLYFTDPDIEAANRNRKGDAPWRNSEREMAFKDEKELTEFLESNLKKLCKKDDYETGFSKALMESKDGE